MVERVCPIPGCYCTTPTGRMAPWNVSRPENNGAEIPVVLKVKGKVENIFRTETKRAIPPETEGYAVIGADGKIDVDLIYANDPTTCICMAGRSGASASCRWIWGRMGVVMSDMKTADDRARTHPKQPNTRYQRQRGID